MRDMGGLISHGVSGGFGYPQIDLSSSLQGVPDMGGFGRTDRYPPGRTEMGGFSQGYSDPYWNDVVLLLRFDGYHGSTNVIDCSPRPKVITVSGCRIVSSDGNGLMGGSAAGGKSDIGGFNKRSLQVWNTNTAAFGVANLPYVDCALGSEGVFNGDYTVEFWAYNGNNTTLMSTPRDVNGSITLAFTNFWNYNANNWTHYVIQRKNGTFQEFVNGQYVGSPGSSTLQIPYTTFTVGANSAHSSRWNGNIGEVRVTRNVARYVGNFNLNVQTYPTGSNGFSNTITISDIKSVDGRPVPGPNYKGDFITQAWLKYLNSAVGSGVSSLTYDLSSGRRPELGDIIVMGCIWRDAGGTTVDTPTGYTLLGDYSDVNGSHQSIFWKLSDGTETTFSNSLTGGTSNMCGFVAIIRNADEAGPQGFVQNGDLTTTNAITGSGLTNVPDRSFCLAVGGEHNYVATPTCTVTGGYTECVDITQGPAGTNSRALDVAFKEIAVGAGGTIGAVTFTWNSNGTRHQVAEMYFPPRPSPQFA